MDTRYHYVRDYIEDGILKVIFVRTAENQSDPYTKNLAVEPYLKHIGKFMFDDVENDEVAGDFETGRMLKGVSQLQESVSPNPIMSK